MPGDRGSCPSARARTIRLGQLLKLADLVDTGADAKPLLSQGLVDVNGETETRRGRQLCRGDVVTVGGRPCASPVALDGRRGRSDLRRSADVDEVDHEDQRLAGLDDATGAAVAVRRGAAG